MKTLQDKLTPRYEVVEMSDTPENPSLLLNIFLFDESDARVELPLKPDQDESIEQAARRTLKEFGEMISDGAHRDQIDFELGL